jgi:hypothetical protein
MMIIIHQRGGPMRKVLLISSTARVRHVAISFMEDMIVMCVIFAVVVQVRTNKLIVAAKDQGQMR